ncbi:unnamed protein product [Lepeophtheirus salmonis]|uniref:(salmon louse) hypothetical protein n=1 Tax=Lepeophtheirus salmonis TaxID=72036 RepID=A0A7R8D7G3_LEPSM|nr:unnamed protein product [Lepeophtheirus salmonis]CAF3026869.1 unnamed protein product [Lepeophtheirus salmonis]
MTDERRVLIPIVPRTFTGTASHVGNAGAVDWNPECGRNIQVLEKHRSPVNFVAWAQAHFLTDKTCTAHLHTLASADSAGNIVVWDVLSAEVKSYFTDPSRSVTGMKWLDGSIENTGTIPHLSSSSLYY